MKSIVWALLLVAIPAVAGAQDFPKMRAGLWQTTSATANAGAAKPATPRVTTICIDASVQKMMMQMAQGMMRGMCSRHELNVSGNTVTGDAVCAMMGSQISTHSVMKFSGDSSYHTVAHMVYNPPLAGRTTGDTTVDGKYAGPCPAGMAPGDMQLPGGKTINLKSIAHAQ